jgi:gluconolactonase
MLLAQAEIATTVSFTEGPAVDSRGNVYFTDIVNSRIWKFTPAGELSIYRDNANGANGLVVDAQDRLIACEGARGRKPRVTRTNLKTGELEVLAESFDGEPFDGPNDVTLDGQGRIYFTDFTGGSVYRIDKDGRLDRILNKPEVQRPNGIQVSPDDKTLYLVEANPNEGGARAILAYDLSPAGKVSNKRVHYNFYPGRSGDGMSIDEQGNLYVSAGLNRTRGTSETLDTKAGVYVISPAGKLLSFHPIEEDTITNNTFGGPDRKTLYVTAGKTLYELRFDIPGLLR